jgi:AcrR family transcriptional regulator
MAVPRHSRARVPARATPRPATQRRQEILKAAILEFAARGYRPVGTAEIARRVGVSEPAIYRHFPSKLALYLAAIDHSTTVIDDAWQALVARAATPLDALRAIGLWSYEQLRIDPPHLTLRARALVETSEPAATERLRAHFADSRRMIESLYRAAQAAGQIPATIDVRARTWAFMALGALLDRTQMLGLAGDLDAEATRAVVASVLPELEGRPPGRR